METCLKLFYYSMNQKIKNFSAIILTGGESKRMGINKALLKLGDKTVIEIISELLAKFFDQVFISANSNIEYDFLKLPIVNDIYKNHGPLFGIHAGLKYSNTENNFFISNDLPLIDFQTIEFIIENSVDSLITIPIIENYPLYICGVYSKKILREIENLFKKNPDKASIKNLTKIVSTKFLEIENQRFYNPKKFINMNTIDDYELTKKYSRKSNE